MRWWALPAIIVGGVLALAAGQAEVEAEIQQSTESSLEATDTAPHDIDWADCRACHPEVQDELPAVGLRERSA